MEGEGYDGEEAQEALAGEAQGSTEGAEVSRKLRLFLLYLTEKE